MRRLLLALALLSACAPFDQVGKAPEFTPVEGSYEHHAMYSTPLPEETAPTTPIDASSLWTAERSSLFGDRRASRRGDILTVVVEIDDKASISNSTDRSRSGSTEFGVPQFFGIPQRIDAGAIEGASTANAVSANGTTSFSGDGSVSRNEKLTLRVAATVVEELPNGVLRIEGIQEVRVNFELRELTVTGYVRPVDISRQNEITYDKIAGAHISYGGRGQISEVQQPGWGQQMTDMILPY